MHFIARHLHVGESPIHRMLLHHSLAYLLNVMLNMNMFALSLWLLIQTVMYYVIFLHFYWFMEVSRYQDFVAFDAITFLPVSFPYVHICYV